MCIAPIRIKNPKKDRKYFVPGVDSDYITVPCGHCEECKDRKRQSIYTRLYYEWQECKVDRGFCINITLTYRDDEILRLDAGSNTYCVFNVSDVQKYIKRIRKYFDQHNRPISLRYFVAMELGENTHRPHYHALFFVHSANVCVSEFASVARSKWTHGFTAHGSKGALVKNAAALNYAAKYVAKSVADDEATKQILDDLAIDYPVGSDEYKQAKRYINGRFLASRGLGLYALKHENEKLLSELQITVPDASGFTKVVPLPTYYDRKLHYDVKFRDRSTGFLNDQKQNDDDIPTYILNNEGYRHIRERFRVRIDYISQRFKTFLNSYYTSDELELACQSACNCSISELREELCKLNPEKVAVYQLLYQNRDVKDWCYDPCTFVSATDELYDFVTLLGVSDRYDFDPRIDVGMYGEIFSADANVTAFRQHVVYYQKKFEGINANAFDFVTYYLSQQHKFLNDEAISNNKAYEFRKDIVQLAKDPSSRIVLFVQEHKNLSSV